MNIIKIIFTNGFILMIPVLAWNIFFTAKLPPEYGPKSFDKNIPQLLLTGENISRSIVFILPLLFMINISTPAGRAGLAVYILGSLAYYISWLLVIYRPDLSWSKGLFGFAAPAYTPLIWLTGISLMADSYYFNIAYSAWHYSVPSLTFLIFHISHAYLAYSKKN